MFKLFLSVLAMSDTGSISTSSMVTDYPTVGTCAQAASQMGVPKPGVPGVWTDSYEKEYAGHKFTMTINAHCSPIGSIELGSRGGIPAPIAGAIQGLLQSMQRQPGDDR